MGEIMALTTQSVTPIHTPIILVMEYPIAQVGKSEAQKGILRKDLSQVREAMVITTIRTLEGYNGFETCMKCCIEFTCPVCIVLV